MCLRGPRYRVALTSARLEGPGPVWLAKATVQGAHESREERYGLAGRRRSSVLAATASGPCLYRQRGWRDARLPGWLLASSGGWAAEAARGKTRHMPSAGSVRSRCQAGPKLPGSCGFAFRADGDAFERAADASTDVDLQRRSDFGEVSWHEEVCTVEIFEHPPSDGLRVYAVDTQPRPQDRVGEKALGEGGNRWS